MISAIASLKTDDYGVCMSKYNKIRRGIAVYREVWLLRFAEKLCRFYIDCIDNARNWSFEDNGEKLIAKAVLERTRGPVFDVGAHSGEYARLIASLDRLRVIHSFEPLPQIAAAARDTCSEFQEIQIHDFGLSDTYGPETIFSSRQYPTTSGTVRFIHDFEKDMKFDEIECNFVTGDIFCAQYSIDTISLLKIDVEGMERRVLSGFTQKLTAHEIETIQFEHGPAHAETGDTIRTLMKFLRSFDFEIFAIYPNGLRTPHIVGVDSESFRGRNFLAVAKTHVAKYHDLIVGAC
jgi:FkbM family methyltransferase